MQYRKLGNTDLELSVITLKNLILKHSVKWKWEV
ncbi:Uncharacterised protein [Chryseobacterium indoltheticum]|uniref:Uncharacterized protein n=1 Tax=Chryseobacterium indoltheticum TaxID=254 RepID=A0A381FNM7_9FLAO|nr:Uncharacterised protein [Chryseobacterium indoltheticum]